MKLSSLSGALDVAPGTACRERAAFTLIEMLVVISLVALLVAILLPALASARMTAKRITSLTQIRGITLALTSYATDNKQSMPYLRKKTWSDFIHDWDDNRWRHQWSRELHESKYVSDIRAFWSPDRFVYGGPPYSRRTDANAKDQQYESVGFGLNQGVFGSTQYDHEFNGGNAPLRLDEASAPTPSDMIMLAETFGSLTTSVGGLNGYFQAGGAKFNTTVELRLYNYQGAVVCSYVDGSAAAVEKSDGGRVSASINVLDNNPTFRPVERRQLGWDTTSASPGFEGPYKGYWAYNNTDEFNYFAPWFKDWRTKWYRGVK
jgi:prepilin-type N-terminal cleavage/methylation domain-containing protein